MRQGGGKNYGVRLFAGYKRVLATLFLSLLRLPLMSLFTHRLAPAFLRLMATEILPLDGCFAQRSIVPQYFPIVWIASRRKNVANDLHLVFHKAHQIPMWVARSGPDLGHRFAIPRDAKWLLSLLHCFQNSVQTGAKFRYRDFLHLILTGIPTLHSTIRITALDPETF